MEKLIAYIFLVNFMFTCMGCQDQNSLSDNSDSDLYISMITFDIYKETIDVGLSLIYCSQRSEILIKSNGFQSLDFEETPPPPPDEPNSIYNVPDRNIELETEVLNLEKEIVKKIESLIEVFEDNDLDSVINSGKIDDGMGIKVTIVFSENRIKDFTLINGATENQREFLRYIFDQVIQKSKSNKEQLKLFLR